MQTKDKIITILLPTLMACIIALLMFSIRNL